MSSGRSGLITGDGPGLASDRATTREGDAGPTRALPYVVAWNLTRRCNLACSHCYIAAGDWHGGAGELSTDECRRISDDILDLVDHPVFVLSGGEPLLREDLESIASHAAAGGATVVVGTNGTRLTAERIQSLGAAGVSGFALSVDSLDPTYHDRFRRGHGALDETLAAVDRLREADMDFVVQTTLTRGNRPELESLIAWAAEAGAVSFNLYFLVATGRGEGMRGLSPAENARVLGRLVELQRDYLGRLMIRSKCQPQLMRHVHEADPESPLLNYATRCSCGVQYCRITPEGKVTPCPYMPVTAGDLRRSTFGEVWAESPVFRELRSPRLGGRCGRCRYRELCGGCRARAFADSGDYLAEDESCDYQPVGDEAPATSAAVRYGMEPDQGLPWSDAARRRMERVPSLFRAVVVSRVETFARDNGRSRVTEELLDEVRRRMPVDFSKRRPFFLRDREDA